MKIIIAFVIGMSIAFAIDDAALRFAGVSWHTLAMNIPAVTK